MALFKVDRKQMSANNIYILLNSSRTIQGISSSAINLMNIEPHNLRKLASSDVSIDMFAPALFDSYPNSKFMNKAGAKILWFNPSFAKRPPSPVKLRKKGSSHQLNLKFKNSIKIDQLGTTYQAFL